MNKKIQCHRGHIWYFKGNKCNVIPPCPICHMLISPLAPKIFTKSFLKKQLRLTPNINRFWGKHQ